MSTTIDQNVLEMRFDNSHFERNVSQSMSTLDKFKQSLRFDGATKGIESVGTATEAMSVKVSHAYAAIQAQIVRWSTTISKSIENTIDQLTTAPIRTGFTEYETQINSTQTILANTESKGSTIDDVNRALEQLNKYADKTIYNFTEMTRNIGTFTAAGIDLDTSVNAIQGIANLAAVSGSTSQQASTAMYQLSQALASGTVKLMDWNSVVNAGMGGQVFQDALKETARVHGVAIDQMIEEHGSFRETLSEGWITSEILTETLSKFTMATEGATEAEIEANKAKLKSLGYTEEQIEGIFKLGNTATNAATKVKTFTQLWDVLKETAQSGWSQSWKIIVGDFEQAKALLTPLADTLTGFINKMNDARNRVLTIALAFTDPIKTMLSKLDGAGLGKIKDTIKAIGDLSDKLEYYQDIVNKVWRGDYNNRGDNPDRFDLLTKDGYDPRIVQDLVNKGYQYQLTVEDIEDSYKKLGVSIETTSKNTDKLNSAQKKSQFALVDSGDAATKAKNAYKNLTDEQLKAAGLTGEEIRLFRALEKEADRLGVSILDLTNDMSAADGRTLLIDALANFGDVITGIGKAAASAWEEIFNPPSLEYIGVRIHTALRSLKKFSEGLRLTDAVTGEWTETGLKFQRIFKGVFAVVDIVTTILGGGLKFALSTLTEILGAFNVDILEMTARLGDALVAFRDWVFEGNALAKAFDWMIDQLPVVVENFKAWFDVFKDTPAVQKLIEAVNAIGDAFAKLTSGEIDTSEFAAFLGENLAKALKSLPEIAMQIGKDFLAGFQNGIGDGFGDVVKDIVDCCLSFVASFAEALGVQSPSWKAYDTATDFFQGFINGTGDMIDAIAKALQPIGEKVIQIFNSFWDFITDENGQVEWGKLFAGGSIVSFIWVLKELVGAWKGIATAFNGIAEAIGGFGELVEGGARVLRSFSKVLDGVAWDLKATALLKMAGAIGILIAAIWVLTMIDDPSKVWKAVNVIIVLAAVLVGLSIAMDKLSSAGLSLDGKTKKLDIKGIQSSILQIGLALIMVAAAAMMIGSMDPEQAKQGFIGLAGIAVGMVMFMAVIGGISRYSGDVTGLGGMMTKIAVAIMLLAVACKLIGMLTPEDMALGLAFITGFTVFVTALSLVSRLAGPQTNKVGGMLIKLSIAAMLMVGLCKLVGMLSPDEMSKGAIFAAGFTVFVGALVASTKIGKDQQIAKLGGLVMSISTSLMLMVGVCKLVGMLSIDEMIKGGLFMAAFGVLLKAMISILKIGTDQQIAKVTGTILAITAAIGILAAVAAILGFMPLEDLAKGVAAVSVLGVIMALMISSLKGAQNVKGAITSMAIAVAVMAAAAVALSFVPSENLMSAAKSMTLVMGAFALMLASLKGLKSPKLGPLFALSGVVVILAGILAVLAYFNIEGSIKTAISLSILLLAFSGAVAILSMIGPMAAGATTAVGALLLLVAAILGIVSLLGFLYQNEGFKKILADGGTALMLLGRAIGGLIGGFIGGIGEGISGSLVNIIQDINTFMDGLAEVTGKASKLEKGSFDGVADLVAVMSSVFGAAVLEKLASGFLGESSIGKFTTDASAFITAIGTISESLNEVTIDDAKIETVVKCGEYFNALLTALPKTGGVAQTLMGEQDLTKFGTACETFADKMTLINEKVYGDNFQFYEDRIQALVDAGLMFTTLLNALPKTNGLVQTLMGEQDMVAFGNACCSFANKMTIINGMVNAQNFQFHSDRIQLLVDAGLMFTTLLSALPKTNGLVQKLMGEQDLAKFGIACQMFAEKMKLVNKTVSEENFEFHQDRIQLLVDAGKSFNTLLTALPKTNGGIQKLMGEQDLTKFADGCSAFATAMSTVSSVITAKGFAINLDAIDTMVTAGNKFNELQNTLPQTGGWWEKVVGQQDISDFGLKVQAFGEAMGAYSTAVSELNTDKITESLTTADSLKKLAESLVDIDAKGITNFAGSGFGEGYIVRIGKTMAKYSEAVSELDTAVVSISVDAAMNLVDMVEDLADLDVSGIKKFDVTAIGSAMKEYSDKVQDVDTVVVSQSISSAMRLGEFISDLVGLDTSGIGNFKPVSIGSSIKHYGNTVSGLDIDGINASLVAATKIKSFITGLAGFNTESVESFASAIETLGGIEITKVTSTFETVGGSLAISMVNGFAEKTSKLGHTVATCITAVCGMLRMYYTSFYLNGSYLGSGLIGGINSKKKAAYNAGYALGQAAVQGEKDGQQSNSPSKLTTLAGHWLGEGLIVGMKEMSKKVYESGHDLGDNATSSVSNTISKIADALNSDLDVQPTIRPVVDLSDVKTGINAIGSLFGSSSMGISANVGAVSSLMNRNGQNGRNDDVVNALDRLNKKMDNLGTTTYQINGVTYDDGSNISAAMQTIARAALRERRV